MTKRRRKSLIGNLTIEIPVILSPELLIGAITLIKELLKLAHVAKIPLQEQKDLTVTVPNAGTKDMTVTIPISSPVQTENEKVATE